MENNRDVPHQNDSKIPFLIFDSDINTHDDVELEQNEASKEQNEQTTSRTSDFNKFENLQIKEIARKATKGRISSHNFKIKARNIATSHMKNCSLSSNKKFSSSTPLNSNLNIVNGFELMQKLERYDKSSRKSSNKELDAPSYQNNLEGSSQNFLANGIRFNEIIRMNNRNNTQSLNGLKYFVHKSAGIKNDQKVSDEQNSYIKGVLQTAQKKLAIREVLTNHNARIIKNNRKGNYKFGKKFKINSETKKQKYTHKRLNSEHICKRTPNPLNQDLILDFICDQKNKQEQNKDIAFENIKNVATVKSPKTKCKHNNSTNKNKEDNKNSKDFSNNHKNKSIDNNYQEVIRLNDLKKRELKPGCIELEIEKLKYFKGQDYDKYSDAIFHVLDRLSQNLLCSQFIKHLIKRKILV